MCSCTRTTTLPFGSYCGSVCYCLQVNKATIGLLRRAEPYIAYGYPNLKSVRELIYKRGFAKVSLRGVQSLHMSLRYHAQHSMHVCCGTSSHGVKLAPASTCKHALARMHTCMLTLACMTDAFIKLKEDEFPSQLKVTRMPTDVR
eukprot:1149753-Pelagomonas_calceolata.AAC.5